MQTIIQRTVVQSAVLTVAFVVLLVSTTANAQLTRQELINMAAKEVLVAARSPRADIRANAIEAAEALVARRGPLAEAALADPDPVVRFAALTVIGKMKLQGAAAGAHQLLNDQNESVKAAAYFALARCFGDNPNAHPQAVDITPMGGLMFSNNPNTRANTAMLIGLLGDRTAIPLLKEGAASFSQRVPQVKQRLVSVQVAEAIVTLGGADTIDAIRAAAFSQFDEVRVIAINTLGRLQDRRFEEAFVEMLKADNPIEVKISAAGTLARFGRGEGTEIVLQSAESRNSVIRAQSAYVLGLFRNQVAMNKLARMLDDPDEQVRISAAAAILGGGKDGL